MLCNKFITAATTQAVTNYQGHHTVSQAVSEYISSNGVTATLPASASTTTPRSAAVSETAIVTSTKNGPSSDKQEETTTSTTLAEGLIRQMESGKRQPDPELSAAKNASSDSETVTINSGTVKQ